MTAPCVQAVPPCGQLLYQLSQFLLHVVCDPFLTAGVIVLLCSSWSFYNTAALVSILYLTLIYQHCLLDVVIAEHIPWSTCCMWTCGVLTEVTKWEWVSDSLDWNCMFIKIKVVDKQDVFFRFSGILIITVLHVNARPATTPSFITDIDRFS